MVVVEPIFKTPAGPVDMVRWIGKVEEEFPFVKNGLDVIVSFVFQMSKP